MPVGPAAALPAGRAPLAAGGVVAALLPAAAAAAGPLPAGPRPRRAHTPRAARPAAWSRSLPTRSRCRLPARLTRTTPHAADSSAVAPHHSPGHRLPGDNRRAAGRSRMRPSALHQRRQLVHARVEGDQRVLRRDRGSRRTGRVPRPRPGSTRAGSRASRIMPRSVATRCSRSRLTTGPCASSAMRSWSSVAISHQPSPSSRLVGAAPWAAGRRCLHQRAVLGGSEHQEQLERVGVVDGRR